MTNTNFKAGDIVNWLVWGEVALAGMVINRITLDEKCAWVTIPGAQDHEEMIVKLENLEAA